jgi:hypothetical protein
MLNPYNQPISRRCLAASTIGLFKKNFKRLVPVAHACNPSYLGGRDQEDLSSKPAWANSSQDPISKENHHKKELVSGSR